MCFSAGASFFTAAVTAAAGATALRQARTPREWPLASTPLFFALQQSVEGSLWLLLPSGANEPQCTALTSTFLTFALLFWPVFAPLTALLIEQNRWRWRGIFACTLIGVAVSSYLASVILGGTQQAVLESRHIVYQMLPPPDGKVGIFYLVATGLAPAISSHPALNVLSIIVVSGSVIAWLAYWDAFVSVWCFFAAAASIVILLHFQRARAGVTAPR